MGLVGLGSPPALGGEGRVRIRHRGERVALEQGDRVTGPAERQCRRQAADSPADDHHPLAS